MPPFVGAFFPGRERFLKIRRRSRYGGSQRVFGSRGSGRHGERGSRSTTGGERRHSGALQAARRRQLGAAILRRQGTAATRGSAGKPQSVPLQQPVGQIESRHLRK